MGREWTPVDCSTHFTFFNCLQ